MVKVLIKRTVTQGQVAELMTLLKRLRALTLTQTGYVSGETLQCIDNPDECLVISTWRSAEDWHSWLNNDQRIRVQDEIDRLLGKKTEYAVYG